MILSTFDVYWPIAGLDLDVELESRRTGLDGADRAMDEFVTIRFQIGDNFPRTIGAALAFRAAAAATAAATAAAATGWVGGGGDGRRNGPVRIGSHAGSLARWLRRVIVLKLIADGL